MVRFGVPGQNNDTLSYTDNRLATVPVVNAPRRPTVNDKKFPMWCEWRVNKDASDPTQQGEFWKLVRFESNGDATWVLIGGGGGSGPLVNVETDDGAPNVEPDAFGELQILGGAGVNVTGQGPGNTVTVSLTGGGAGIDSVTVDFITAPGVNPVIPDGAGLISVLGNTVANATNANSPIATHSRALNEFDIDVQVAAAITGAPADVFDAGLSSYDDTQFTVDINGFVQLLGGGGSPAYISTEVDANTAPGTDPVLADGSGIITVAGAAVAAHSVPLETHSRAANAYNIEVQVASDRTGAPGNTNDAGVCSFDDTDFQVDVDGYVTLQGSVLKCAEATIDVTPMVANTWYTVNSASPVTLTLPPTATTCDFFGIIRKGTGDVSIAQQAGQTIHYNIVDTTTGVTGSLDSNNQWDVVLLKCVTADTDFVVISSSGSWTAN